MQKRLPNPRKNRWTIERVASRWKIPVAFARLELEAAGVEFVKIPRAPRLGIRLLDLLQYEETARARRGARTENFARNPLEVVR
jgi:hypothetical protein